MVSLVRQAQVLRFQGQNSPFPFLILAVCSTPPSSPSILPPPYYPSKKARKMKSSKRKGNDRFFAGILIPAETTRDLFPRGGNGSGWLMSSALLRRIDWNQILFARLNAGNTASDCDAVALVCLSERRAFDRGGFSARFSR